MQRENKDFKPLAAPAAVATKGWAMLPIFFAVTALIFIAVWYLGGDLFPSTPTFGETRGKAPGATQAPVK